jgi:phosphoglycolate phosphatase-like HAD superfamily hydrolase
MTNNILPSWNDTEIKRSVLKFIERISDKDSEDFIPEENRIAVFDNDGTLWTEQPFPVQLLFALDRIKELAELNPEMKNSQPFKAFIEKDIKTISTFSKKDIMTFLFKTHDTKTPEEFESNVKHWFENAVHPRFKFSFYDSVFKPQVELLQYLRENDFKTFIVSGGGINFMRVVSEKIYGISSDRVIGSSGKTKIEYEGSKPLITRLPELGSFDDREEKVNNIYLHIGKRPVFAFGNSDGDLAMLRYTLAGEGLKMALLIHHDDSEREVAYDKDFKISPLKEALEVAEAEGINVVSMKNDWNKVF